MAERNVKSRTLSEPKPSRTSPSGRKVSGEEATDEAPQDRRPTLPDPISNAGITDSQLAYMNASQPYGGASLLDKSSVGSMPSYPLVASSSVEASEFVNMPSSVPEHVDKFIELPPLLPGVQMADWNERFFR
jgi:hypothetical protein